MVTWGRQDRPLVIAHRGASADRTENTLEAFRLAAEQGADGVELDVMRCGSGEVVVFHDDDLKRLTACTGPVRETPLTVLREIELRGGGRIPTLDEVLAALGGKLLANIELKSPERSGLAHLAALRDDGLATGVAALIARHALADRVLVSSFDPILLGRFRRAAPRIGTGLLVHHEMRRPLREGWVARVLRPQAMHPEARMVSARAVERWHAAGHAVNVWTVDDPHEMAWLHTLGVDGIITNRPALAREALARTATLGAR